MPVSRRASGLNFLQAKGNWQMARSKKPVTTTGNIGGEAPILASERQNTEDESKPSPASIRSEQTGTKPVSTAEALSLWQTACFDLQSYGFSVAILARNNRIFMLLAPPASIGKLTYADGHFRIDGVPVSDVA